VDLSVVEQRYRAVLAVERGEPKIVAAAQFGVSRQSLHTWLTRYARDGLAGLMDRTRRPDSCPHQADAAVAIRVCELRREPPLWGPGGSLMSWPTPLPSAAHGKRTTSGSGLLSHRAAAGNSRDNSRPSCDLRTSAEAPGSEAPDDGCAFHYFIPSPGLTTRRV
jgi:hypothetical protein